MGFDFCNLHIKRGMKAEDWCEDGLSNIQLLTSLLSAIMRLGGGAAVLAVEVVGVFPDIEGKQRGERFFDIGGN